MSFSRRSLLNHIAYAGAALPLALPRLVRAVPASGKLNLGCVGVAGKGWEDLIGSSGEGKRHNVVALCDTDHRTAAEPPRNLSRAQLARPVGIGRAASTFPSAKTYFDFRRMLDDKQIDAVTVSIPDHMHALVTLAALQAGKHVYTQKPMTATVHEARVIRLAAAASPRLSTQMGNQHHSSIGYRCLVQIVRKQIVGKIREVHIWTSSPSWPCAMTSPAPAEPTPDSLHWNHWLGMARPRPFATHVYHPFNWRGWLDFGTGALGDMGCHIIDPAFWSLELAAPLSIRSLGPAPTAQAWPEWGTVQYTFAPTPHTAGPLKLTWYDGGKQPPVELARMGPGRKLTSSGSIYVGEKGTIVVSHTPSVPRLYPEEQFRDYQLGELKTMYENTPSLDHYQVWTSACVEGKQTHSNFDYAGRLTETVMLGNIALRFPDQELHWDPQSMRFPNLSKADEFLRRDYRKDFSAPQLTDA